MAAPSSNPVAMEQQTASPEWQKLISSIHRKLDGDSADIDEIKQVLDAYKSNPADWKRFALFDDHCYTRNLVDDGNGRFNIMLLCWDVGQASSIHSHAGSHCFMKILDGALIEQLFEKPEAVQEGQPLDIQAEARASENDNIYINDDLGMHRVINPSHTKRAVSLHIYSPPYNECLCFDERTGQGRTSGKITFFSKNGQLCDDEWDTNMGQEPDYC